MASSRPETELEEPLVKKIDKNEIKIPTFIGRGSFGTVWKAKWGGTPVALKCCGHGEKEKHFKKELEQLSRTCHDNIVKLYAMSDFGPPTHLSGLFGNVFVLELADRGSLHDVLRQQNSIKYTAAQAMYWALQCARGVAYLHGLSIIHRDLKPLNLLLFGDGNTLKICDFGTACVQNSTLTVNTGTPVWMAPEVFKGGGKYDGKADVYSWSLILWEILSRQKPFESLGKDAAAFKVQMAAELGTRPPTIIGVPRPIEELYKQCWDNDPTKRPEMKTVVEKIEMLLPFFCKVVNNVPYLPPLFVNNDTSEDSMKEADEHDSSDDNQEFTEEDLRKLSECKGELKLQPDPKYFACLSIETAETKGECYTYVPFAEEEEYNHHNPSEASFLVPSAHGLMGKPPSGASIRLNGESSYSEFGTLYDHLDKEFHPIPPDPNCPQSVRIFKEHEKQAVELLHYQNEAGFLNGNITKLNNEVVLLLADRDKEVKTLTAEKESLLCLKAQLEDQLRTVVPSG